MADRNAVTVRGLRALTTLTCVLICSAPRAEPLTFPAPQSPSPHGSSIQAMIECPAWSSSLGRCLRPANGLMHAGPGSPAHAPPGEPDYDGIRRDTYYFLGLQLTIVGVLFFMPESVSGWSEEQRNQHHARKWWNNVTDPTWDEDEHYINYVLHPYWGAAYYVRARERGFDPRGAFWYSYLLSTLYEAGLEAFFEPVSIQDFFVTPIVGSWLGGHFMNWREAARERMAGSSAPRFRDRALLVMTDPLGNAADFIDRRLGRDLEFHASPFVRVPPAATGAYLPNQDPPQGETVYGVRLHLRW